MSKPTCPMCEGEMQHIEGEPDTNIIGGYSCLDDECDGWINDWEVDDTENYI